MAALILPTIGVFATPTHPSPTPTVSISSVRPVDLHPNYLQWYVNNTGDAEYGSHPMRYSISELRRHQDTLTAAKLLVITETIQVEI